MRLGNGALVALLVDAGPAGTWAAAEAADRQLATPHLVRYEVATSCADKKMPAA